MSCTGTSSDTGLHDQESGIPARRAFPGRSVDMAQTGSNLLRLGVDVGSTTVKTVVLDPTTNDVLFTRYQRHNAHQADTVRQLL